MLQCWPDFVVAPPDNTLLVSNSFCITIHQLLHTWHLHIHTYCVWQRNRTPINPHTRTHTHAHTHTRTHTPTHTAAHAEGAEQAPRALFCNSRVSTPCESWASSVTCRTNESDAPEAVTTASISWTEWLHVRSTRYPCICAYVYTHVNVFGCCGGCSGCVDNKTWISYTEWSHAEYKTYVYVNIFMCVYKCVYVCTYINITFGWICIHMYTYAIYIFTLYIYIYINIYVYKHGCISIWMKINVHIYIYIYIYIRRYICK